MAVALITGGSRGIGAATALRLAEDGHDIALAYRSGAEPAQRVASAVRERGRRAATFAADLADPTQATDLVPAVAAALGPVGILIANAGTGEPTQQDPRELTLEQWERTIAINLRAPFLVARAALGTMLERRTGRIVLVSSVAAYTGGIIGPHYAASKAGLHGLAHSLSQFASGRGVSVNVVAPALIATDMMPADDAARERLATRIPVGRLGTAEEVADLIATIVRNPFITNQSILIDGGMHPS
jgi:3-oxoacyl-[acyl-carrier protein] reductase